MRSTPEQFFPEADQRLLDLVARRFVVGVELGRSNFTLGVSSSAAQARVRRVPPVRDVDGARDERTAASRAERAFEDPHAFVHVRRPGLKVSSEDALGRRRVAAVRAARRRLLGAANAAACWRALEPLSVSPSTSATTSPLSSQSVTSKVASLAVRRILGPAAHVAHDARRQHPCERTRA